MIKIKVNGQDQSWDGDPTLPLLWYLKTPVTSGSLALVVLLWHGFLIVGQFGANLTPVNVHILDRHARSLWINSSATPFNGKSFDFLPRRSVNSTTPCPIFLPTVMR